MLDGKEERVGNSSNSLDGSYFLLYPASLFYRGKHIENHSSGVEKEQKTISTPNEDKVDINILNLTVRKATHVLVFGILALLFYKSFEPVRYSFLLAWFLTILYAITDEYHQSFMPGRVAAYMDVIYDSFGALLALIMIVAVKNYNELSSKNP